MSQPIISQQCSKCTQISAIASWSMDWDWNRKPVFFHKTFMSHLIWAKRFEMVEMLKSICWKVKRITTFRPERHHKIKMGGVLKIKKLSLLWPVRSAMVGGGKNREQKCSSFSTTFRFYTCFNENFYSKRESGCYGILMCISEHQMLFQWNLLFGMFWNSFRHCTLLWKTIPLIPTATMSKI